MLRTDTHDVKFDVMCFCETWLRESVPNSLLSITGYNLVRADRNIMAPSNVPKSGGGLCTYYKDYFICSILKELTCCTPDLETLVVTLSRPDHNLVVILNIYRPPDGSWSTCLQMLTDLSLYLYYSNLY